MPQVWDLRCNVAGLLGLRLNVQGLILVGDWWFEAEGWRGGLWSNKVLIKAGRVEFGIPGLNEDAILKIEQSRGGCLKCNPETRV